MRYNNKGVEFFLDVENFEELEPFIVGYITSSSRCSGGCSDIENR